MVLLIDDYGRTEELNQLIKSYHELLEDYRSKQAHHGVIHTLGLYLPYLS